jgi:hypothetical protein
MPSSHSEQLLYRRYWQRSILYPLWTQQFLLQLVALTAFWFALTIFWNGEIGNPSLGKPGHENPTKRKERITLGIFFAMYLTLVLATLAEIVLFCTGSLQPKGYFYSQLLKTVLSVVVWAVLVMYPLVIKNPLVSRLQATIGMEAAFAWLQIPMLSSLVHASLVWHDERKIRQEREEHSAQLHAQAQEAERQRLLFPLPPVRQTNEFTPLLANTMVRAERRRRSSIV